MTRRAYFETPSAGKPTQRFRLWDSVRYALLTAIDGKPSMYKQATHPRSYAGYITPSYYPAKR